MNGSEMFIKLREALNMSQSELGRQMGLHSTTICKIEAGTRQASRLMEIYIKNYADAMGVDLEDKIDD